MQNILQLIKNFKRVTQSLFLTLILVGYGLSASAQAAAPQVSITVNILPPYSPYYSDYAGVNASKVLLIVRNLTATPKKIKLTGQLNGDNGIRITTKSNYIPLQPIILNPNETKQLNGTALKDIFDLSSLNVYGVDKVKLVQSSRLPEGNYSFCIQAVDMNTNQVISSNAPLGCTNIAITYPDAPILVSPGVNGSVFATSPQSIVLNWLNPGFAPMGTQYVLQIAEMPLRGGDPNQVLNSVSFPLVKKTLNGFSYVLSPSDPPLAVGKRYAWRVKAVDPSGKVVFKNGGVSSANVFTYGNNEQLALLNPDAPFLISPVANTVVQIPLASISSSLSPNLGLNKAAGAKNNQILFSWGNKVVLPVGIAYTFQVAEMPNVRKDPNEVLISARATDLTINRKIVNSTSTPLTPSDPQLKVGKRYAWRVVATDPSGKIAFKNGGISKANEFRYGEERPSLPSVITLNKPEAQEGIEKLNELSFKWTFTDNTALNDNVGFYNERRGVGNSSGSKAKYELYLTKLKTGEQRLVDLKAHNKKLEDLETQLDGWLQVEWMVGSDATNSTLTAISLEKLRSTPPSIYADNGIAVPVDKETIDFASSPAMGAYLKDGSDYEWYVQHTASGTVSEKGRFMIRVKDFQNLKLSLVGNLRYNFYDQYLAGAPKRTAIEKEELERKEITIGETSKFTLTESERGFPLANKGVQVLKVSLLAPVFKVTRKAKVIENGVEVTKFVVVDSIAPLSDLIKTYKGALKPKVNNTVLIASSITDATGGFKIQVPLGANNTKVIDPNVVMGGKSFALVEGLVVKVADNRFSDPNWFIVPGSASDVVALGESMVEAYGYKLETTFLSNGQRNNKGKLYLLRNEQQLVNGEVQNITATKKDIPVYLTQYLGNGPVISKNGTQSYNIVGVTNIDVPANTSGNPTIINKPFINLVTSLSNADNYTLYYEPSGEQDGIAYSPQKISNIGGKTFSYQSTDWENKNITEKASFTPKFVAMQVSGRYTYTWVQPGSAKNTTPLPLPEGTRLKLVKGTLIKQDGRLTITDEILKSTTTVTKNGEYRFDVGIQDYDDFSKTGDLFITIDSKYYFSQVYRVSNPNDKKNVIIPTDLNATVRQFTYKNKVGYIDRSTPTANTLFKKGLQVFLCREITADQPMDRPKDEGDPAHKTWFRKTYELKGKDKDKTIIGTYEIVDRTISEDGGAFEFKRLVVPASSNENYHVFAEPIASSPENYESMEDHIIQSGTGDSFTIEKKGIFVPDQAISLVTESTLFGIQRYVNVEPMEPYIDGAVYPKSNTSTSVLTKVLVEMFNIPIVKGGALPTNDDELAAKAAGKSPVANYITDDNGRFLFDKIAVNNNVWKLLRLTKQGFITTYKMINSGKPLVKGQRGNEAKIFMELPKEIYVTVKNSDKQNIPARIIVGDDFSWMDYEPGTAMKKTIAKTPKGTVHFMVIPVDRANNKVTEFNINVDNIKGVNKIVDGQLVTDTKSIDFEVGKIQHVLYVNCIIKGTNKTIPATVTVLNTTKFTQTPKYFGGYYNEVKIAAAGTQFDLRIVPNDINYTIAKTQVHSDGLSDLRVDVYVEPAATVTIKATEEYNKYIPGVGFLQGHFDIAKQKSSNYSFYIDELEEDEYEVVNPYGSGALALLKLALSDTRVVSRVPLSQYLNVSASKKDFLGDTKKLTSFGAENLSVTLDLKISNIAASSIHGFPIELTSSIKQDNGQYLISGQLNPNVPSGNLQATSTTGKLKFRKVLVDVFTISGKGAIIAPVKPIVFEQNSIDATLFNKYNVKIINKDGLSLKPEKDKGSILGKVALDPSSLSKGVTTSVSDNLGNGNYLYLNRKINLTAAEVYDALSSAKTSDDIQTFSTATSELSQSSYFISNQTGKRPTFYGADGMAIIPDKNGITLNANWISFDGNVQTSLANTTGTTPVEKLIGANINAKGTFILTSGDFYSVGSEKTSIKLRNWDLNINSWAYGATGFRAYGNLNTLGLTIPFTELSINRDKIGFGIFDIKQLKLMDTFPVTLNGSEVSVSFGFDKGFSNIGGAWSVSVLSNTKESSIASIKGLEDLEPTDEIKIKNISLYDTGDENDTRILLADDQAPVTLNGVANFKPGTMSGTSKFVNFRGDLNMAIPGLTGLEAVTYDLKYVKDATRPTGLRHDHDKNSQFKNLKLDTKGILVEFKNIDQEFSNGTLKLYGTLKDKDPYGKDKYEIPVRLTKTRNGTNLEVMPQANGDKFIYLNKVETSTYLADATGGTAVINNQWNDFTFGGLLTQKTTGLAAEDGIKPSPMTFTIKGDIVANTAELGVKGMDAGPMKNFSIVYDFEQGALIGSGHLTQSTSFADLELDAELKIGKATDWYIFSSGKATVDMMPIFKDIGVAFMVGNTTISPSQRGAFLKHFGGNIKPSATTLQPFNGELKGIMLMVSAEMKIPLVPTFNIDLSPVAKCEFTNGLYAAAYFKLNFAEGAEVTLGGRVGAYVKISAGASIGLACAGVSLRAETGAEIQAKLNLSSKQFAASLGLVFELEGSAYVGVGMCDSNCQTLCVDVPLVGNVCSPLKCYRAYYNKKLTIGAAATLSNKGISLDSDMSTTEN